MNPTEEQSRASVAKCLQLFILHEVLFTRVRELDGGATTLC